MKFSGQGTLYMMPLSASGALGKAFTLGCLDDFEISSSQEKWEHFETCSGFRQLDATGVKSRSVTASATATDWSLKALEQLLAGTSKTAAGDKAGSVSSEVLDGAAAAAGDFFFTKRLGISTVVITDSAGTPATVPATQYTVEPKSGRITLNPSFVTGTLVYPLKVAYTFSEPNWVAMYTQGLKDTYFRFDGVNTQNGNSKVIYDFYKGNLNAAETIPLLNEEHASFAFNIDFLADISRPVDGAFGQFGRVVASDFGGSFGP